MLLNSKMSSEDKVAKSTERREDNDDDSDDAGVDAKGASPPRKKAPKLQKKQQHQIVPSDTPVPSFSQADSTLLPIGFTPSENDVVCGRARENFHHDGNRRFRQLIEKNIVPYLAARTKFEKSETIAEIVDIIQAQSPGGGFVRKDMTTGRWYQLGEAKARDKVGHAIRKAVRELEESQAGGSLQQTAQTAGVVGNPTISLATANAAATAAAASSVAAAASGANADPLVLQRLLQMQAQTTLGPSLGSLTRDSTAQLAALQMLGATQQQALGTSSADALPSILNSAPTSELIASLAAQRAGYASAALPSSILDELALTRAQNILLQDYADRSIAPTDSHELLAAAAAARQQRENLALAQSLMNNPSLSSLTTTTTTTRTINPLDLLAANPSLAEAAARWPPQPISTATAGSTGATSNAYNLLLQQSSAALQRQDFPPSAVPCEAGLQSAPNMMSEMRVDRPWQRISKAKQDMRKRKRSSGTSSSGSGVADKKKSSQDDDESTS